MPTSEHIKSGSGAYGPSLVQGQSPWPFSLTMHRLECVAPHPVPHIAPDRVAHIAVVLPLHPDPDAARSERKCRIAEADVATGDWTGRGG